MRLCLLALFLLVSSPCHAQTSTYAPPYNDTKAKTAVGWSRTAPYVYLTTSTDNVGIGSASPRYKLEVDGSLYAQELTIDGYIYDTIPTLDDTMKGRVFTGTAGEDLVVDDAVYMSPQGTLRKAGSDATTTMACIGLSMGSYSSGASGTFLREGHFRNDGWSFTTGSSYPNGGILWVSGTAGALTTTQPTGTGKQVQAVGFATGLHTGYFSPNLAVGEL